MEDLGTKETSYLLSKLSKLSTQHSITMVIQGYEICKATNNSDFKRERGLSDRRHIAVTHPQEV